MWISNYYSYGKFKFFSWHCRIRYFITRNDLFRVKKVSWSNGQWLIYSLIIDFERAFKKISLINPNSFVTTFLFRSSIIRKVGSNFLTSFYNFQRFKNVNRSYFYTSQKTTWNQRFSDIFREYRNMVIFEKLQNSTKIVQTFS